MRRLFQRLILLLSLAFAAALVGCGLRGPAPAAVPTTVAPTATATSPPAPAASPIPATPTLPATPPDISQVDVSGQADGAPAGCTVETVAELLQALAQAVNDENPDIVPLFFGRSEGAFQWYCMHEGGEPFTAYTLEELEAYFGRRYEQGERWQLQSVTVNGWWSGLLHFGPVVFARTAADLDGPVTALGKGAYSCERETFAVLCLGGAAGREAEGAEAGSGDAAGEGPAQEEDVSVTAPPPGAEIPRALSAALPGTAEGFELVGHAALGGIGWHAGLALWQGGVVVAEADLPAVRALRDEAGVVQPARFAATHSVALLGETWG